MDFKKSLNKLRDKTFQKVHTSNLVYNTCWEDPAIDRKLLNFDSESKIVMITSAGCNALDYLLDDPAIIHTIDMNPKQNALMELKLELFKNGDYGLLKSLFLKGRLKNAGIVYRQTLRDKLSKSAREFWDIKFEKYFDGKKSFYFRGTSGRFAWLFMKYINSSDKSKKLAQKLVNAQSLDEQKEIYKDLEKKIMSNFAKWVINRHITLALLGVPRAQRNLIVEKYPGGMAGFVGDKLKHMFTNLPMTENYFWRLYMTGEYSESCSPNYLKEENFETIKSRIDRIKPFNGTISEFLDINNNIYSHFILLDHQDWMAAHIPKALEEEWNLILKNSSIGSKILMRSAAENIDFIPQDILKKLKLSENGIKDLHKTDRVGTYGTVLMGEII